MGTVCVCVWSGACSVAQMASGCIGGAQGHADSSRHPFTVEGQGEASCGLGLDDVAVRDLHSAQTVEILWSGNQVWESGCGAMYNPDDKGP